MAKWIKFIQTKYSGKTNAWVIRTLDEKTTLGEIKWNGHWRKYCFYPVMETVFDSNCLTDIIAHMAQAQQDWKDGKVFKEDDNF